jgi:phenylalanyl-tRNA synthetase beta chain
MRVPLSWLKDYVDITLPIEDLAHRLTMAGLEVEEIIYVGLPMPENKIEGRSGGHLRRETKISGIEWDPEKIVVGAILEVMPHPNADRLVLCRLDDGIQEHIVLTGAPNLFEYKGKGPLERPLKVAYAREGAQIIDGHQPGQKFVKLKRAKIRGVESYSMACSEKELGISDDHEGIIILDNEAPVGLSLVDYMGDAVFDIAITPNIARDANIFGVAREVAALTGQKLHAPSTNVLMEGPSIQDKVTIVIQEPQLNPRFVFGLIEDIKIYPSPYEVQRRLRLAGMRPINNIVDATNYTMLEIGEPLHAFDYDVLVKRAGGKSPTIITRTANPGEQLTTLDDIERTLDDFTILVCDTAGALAMAGVMGGEESEVSEGTKNVLLEGAAWNFINVRRTLNSQRMSSEAGYRFSRGVHPALAETGVLRGLELMRRWTGGIVAKGLVDNYPLPPIDPVVEITPEEVERWLGVYIQKEEIVDILQRLEFQVETNGNIIQAKTPPHRLDIGTDIIGVADLIEEIARIYGYDRIPETRMSDALPPQKGNLRLEREERIRDLLVNLGLQEVITYRMTSPENEARHLLPDEFTNEIDHLKITNPIVNDRNVLRRSLLASMLEVAERNARLTSHLALFEIGPVFLPSDKQLLPDEPLKLAILLMGNREPASWQSSQTSFMDFYDLKGLISSLFAELHIQNIQYVSHRSPSFHPGKCASILIGNDTVGVMGELHPLVRQQYDLPDPAQSGPVFAAEFNLDHILPRLPERYDVDPIPAFPPVLEDLAVVLDEQIPAAKVVDTIKKAGGQVIKRVELFDVYRGAQIGVGKKSLAYGITYQSPDRTLTDKDISKVRKRIIQGLESELGAVLRS